MDMGNAGVAIEWLILADAAQVVGNKLYLLGGGWDVLTVSRPLPIQHPLAIAISVRVPWNETNQKHKFEVELVHEDGQSLLKSSGQFEVGRPPGIRPGQDQRAQLAMSFGVKLEKGGTYVIIGRLEGLEQARTTFTVNVPHSSAAAAG
jgi:hypothetical protein